MTIDKLTAFVKWCVLLERENAVVLSFDVAALTVQNLVVTFEHLHSASLVTGILLRHHRHYTLLLAVQCYIASEGPVLSSGTLKLNSINEAQCYMKLICESFFDRVRNQFLLYSDCKFVF